MPGGKECVPRFDHFSAIPRPGDEVHVALSRDVEGVALRATHHILALLQITRADRAPKEPDGLV